MHFHNADLSGHSPLHNSRGELRRAELTALFAHVRRSVGGEVQVVGTSWLYNLPTYCRLFPRRYVASGRVVQRFRSMPQWGQFVDRTGRVKVELARRFLAAIAAKASASEVLDAFPLRPLAVKAPARCFCEHYGVE